MTEQAAATAPAPAPPEPPQRSMVSMVLRGGTWQSIAQFTPLFVNLVLTPYVIHGLGVTRYGLYILVNTIAGFLGSFDGGIGASAQRFFAVYAGSDDRVGTTRLLTTLSGIVLSIGGLLFCVLFFGVPAGLDLFTIPPDLRPEAVFLLRTMAVIVGFGLFRGLFSAVLNSRQRYMITALTNIGSYVIYVVGVILTVQHGWGLRGIAITFVAQASFAAFSIVPNACRYLTRAGLSVLPRSEIGRFFQYAWKVQVVGLMGIINLQADALTIGAVLPVRQVGVYGAGANFAMQLRNIPTNVLSPIQAILGRSFGRAGTVGAHPDFVRLQRLWVRGCTGWIVVALGAVYFAVLSWLGPEFRLGAVVAVILLAGHLVNLWTGVLVVWVQVIGKPELEARYGVLGVLLNVPLTVALIFPFGVLGVVAATTTAQIACSLYLLRITKSQVVPTPPPFIRDIPVLAALAAIATTVLLELLAFPHAPEGAAGLAYTALVASPGVLVYASLTWGPRRVASTVTGQFRKLKSA